MCFEMVRWDLGFNTGVGVRLIIQLFQVVPILDGF